MKPELRHCQLAECGKELMWGPGEYTYNYKRRMFCRNTDCRSIDFARKRKQRSEAARLSWKQVKLSEKTNMDTAQKFLLRSVDCGCGLNPDLAQAILDRAILSDCKMEWELGL